MSDIWAQRRYQAAYLSFFLTWAWSLSHPIPYCFCECLPGYCDASLTSASFIFGSMLFLCSFVVRRAFGFVVVLLMLNCQRQNLMTLPADIVRFWWVMAEGRLLQRFKMYVRTGMDQECYTTHMRAKC
ncbi:hypothetical protein FVEG_17530 [Fusarium verticillioides 7600]|uniref:Uncharacterized protein n=1 Tax=Gibberella moniliformis (strain M3125 / FGSC 7600) TaxID=334819 RepID=W7N703_GIBM7|nr:hypothetical protein FVEG_17530 [Fusarium verticillioides 7600]EWG55474.1 hypothetical protein FVEG_17530 [Fusarium verticillioides 7600]